MDEIALTLRREFRRRITGDEVTHWIASVRDPRIAVQARSIATVRRKVRDRLAECKGWNRDRANAATLVFEPGTFSPVADAALVSRNAAMESLRNSQIEAEQSTRHVIRTLLVGPPVLSVREVAEVLGMSSPSVQRIAKDTVQVRTRQNARVREREATLNAVEQEKFRRELADGSWRSVLPFGKGSA